MMKVRVISALVGLLILAVVYVFIDTLLLNVLIGVIGLIAVHELLTAVGLKRYKSVMLLSMVMAAIIPFVRASYIKNILIEVFFALLLLYFILLLYHHASLNTGQIAMSFFFSISVPLFFSCSVYIRDDFGTTVGGFYLLMALGAAWLSDTCAYFAGINFGRHKLAPHVSPKKTIEGAIGGIVGATLLMQLLALGYRLVAESMGHQLEINHILLLVVTPLFSLIGMVGDLCASVIKRQYGVKDFGNIMPGHGGILDRFDSVLFTLPSVYILLRHIEIVSML